MGKLKLSKKEVSAVKDSITHWKRDIQAKLKKGIAIMGSTEELCGWIWEDDQAKVLCYSFDCPLCKIYRVIAYDCPLCKIYRVIAYDCSACPYRLKYGISCDDLHWRIFIKNPCLKTCNEMIKALENILK